MNCKQYGFVQQSTRELQELSGTLHVFEHEKTGAKLVWLERAEENKTFAIAFQTQPWDDTGVFHILEHSVLCGSERYPVKEPFVELMKSSLNTFLNAMTFPDKTVYPVSSRNDQDFINLMRVYMDAVLHPLIHSKPEIFGQEGWHYELTEDSVPSYKGVVFNEMKGAFASPDTLLESAMNRRLFPDTCYRWVSGGDPEHIPELTYEQFAAAHKRLYHPSNSYIFLDGRMDIDHILSILDGEYLSAYDRAGAPAPITMQGPVDGGRAKIDYELSPEEGLAGRTRLALGRVACTFRNREAMTALQVLSDLLCGDNQAPLKRRLLEAGLAKDVQMSLRDGILQPWVLLEARDIDAGKTEVVRTALWDELERLCREGLDHRRILAALDNLEFQMRQRDYGEMPQGLMLAFQVLESWLYGGDPAANLEVGGLFDRLRQKCEEGYFEGLLKAVLLQNSHGCEVLLLPSHTIGGEKQKWETDRLRAAQSGWDANETAQIKKKQADIDGWQETPDSAEALATIPMLRLDQIPAEPEKLPIEETEAGGLPLLSHTLPTGGITYVNLYFSIDDLDGARLAETAFLCHLLGSLDTTAHGMDELQTARRSLLGSLSFSVEAYGAFGQPNQCRTFLCVSASMLDGKAAQAMELVAEMAVDTVLDDPKKVYALLCQRRTALSEQIAMAGHSFSVGRTAAGCTTEGAVKEHTGGIAYYRWMKELEADFDARFSILREELKALSAAIFCQKRLTVSVTSTGRETEGTVAGILTHRLPKGTCAMPETSVIKPWGRKREGIVIPVDVSFAAMGGTFPEAGRGIAKVMGRVASLAYLWNAVRVQGGAYGVGMLLDGAGMAGFYSYRDPSAARTLGCYRQTAEVLASLDDVDMTAFVLGAVAESDPLLTPRMRGKVSDARYWRGITHETLTQIRWEMLSAAVQDVKTMANRVRTVTEDGCVCVLGSQRQLDACAGELDTVETL